MEQGMVSATNGDRLKSAIQSKPFVAPDRLPSPPRYLSNGGDLFGLYSPIFSPNERGTPTPPLPGSASASLAQSTLSLDEGDAAAAIKRRLYLTLQYREIAERYELCLSHLRDAAEEAEALRRENADLRDANGELIRRLTLLSGKQHGRVAHPPPLSLADEFRRLGVGEETSPTSVLGLQEGRFGRRGGGGGGGEKRTSLPKSISVRSSGFLKLNPTAGSDTMRVTSPAMIGSQQQQQQQQRVFVGCKDGAGEGKGEGGRAALELELDVYNQGMFKTELCNKWEERGECPYGEHCQFAHGIAELRPVIRHPRYKTELCRMVLAGDTCPYGHRCHFRHALTPNDLLRPSH